MYGEVLIPWSYGYSQVHLDLKDKFETFSHSNRYP